MNILVFGKTGQIGTELARDLASLGDLVLTDREDMDLTDLAGIEDRVREVRPRVIVNAAAYTAVDRAESEPDIAMRVNADAPGVIARAARELDSLLVHYSTDYVFSGTAHRPYREEDPVAPDNVYGRSKLAGERAIQASGARYLILRTSWVYSNTGHNFLNTMLRLASQRSELRVVNDQTGAPTYARVVSRVTAELIADLGERDPGSRGRSGIYHVACQGTTNWSAFARAILEEAGIDNVQVIGIPTADYPTPARRPAYSVLATDKVRKDFAVTLPDWRDALRDCLRDRERAK